MARTDSTFQNVLEQVQLGPESTPAGVESAPIGFPEVAPEELAFAVALFVGIVQGQLPFSTRAPFSADEEVELADCRRALDPICAGENPPPRREDVFSYQATLGRVLLVTWQLYRGHEHQASICARVLNFYLLTERSAGKAVERWVMPCAEDPKLVLLHPALIEGLATIPLDAQGKLSESAFLAHVEAIAEQRS